jgi:hypothetical protein
MVRNLALQTADFWPWAICHKLLLRFRLLLYVTGHMLRVYCGAYDFHVSIASSGSFQCLRPFITQSK